MVRLLGAAAAGGMLSCRLLLLLCAVELELGAGFSTLRGFYVPPADGSLLAPARRTDGVVRTIDRIYHGGGKVGYLLYLDGSRFQLDMERDESVRSALGETARAECLYRGTVDSEPESLAVFNLCGGGLDGFFAVRHARYTITPIVRARGHERDARTLQDKDAELALHAFTRESFSFEAEASSCGTRDGRSRRGARRKEHRRSGSGSSSGARHKRSVSRARHVELLLVADVTMVKKYGKDLDHYLLTLASIASKLYGHASIENPVRLSVVKVTKVSEKEKGLEVTKNAAATLKSFCKWQNQQNPLDDDHQHHHDAAILFTRQVNKQTNKCINIFVLTEPDDAMHIRDTGICFPTAADESFLNHLPNCVSANQK